jgi:spermidine/putrescine transport system permease protein
MAFLLGPIIIVVLFSFNSSASLSFPFAGLSLRWYRQILAASDVHAAFLNSAEVALVTAAVVFVIGTCAAIATSTARFRGRGLFIKLVMVPAALPALVIGIALANLFIALHITLSLTTVAVGHIVFTLPFYYVVAQSALERFDPLLPEAAKDLGAGPWIRFTRVVLPSVGPALFGGVLLVIALSWDELFISFFTIGNQVTVPLLIWAKVRLEVDPSVNAISTVLLAGSIVIVAVMRRFMRGIVVR